MKYITGCMLVVALSCVSLTPLAAMAAANTETASDFVTGQPLMIIRFNQPRVNYQMPLYSTISQALKAKPSAVFDIIAVAPRTNDSISQAYNTKAASENAHKVLSTLHEIGLPPSRISLINAIDTVSASEVRIFVH